MIKLNFKSIFLESLGTFFIVFTCSFGFTVYNNNQIDETGLALLNGFVTMIMVWLARNSTMGQFNPLLTILLLLLKKIKVFP
jgi:glycerol uptake facilitator-like aquaporin